MAPSCPPCRCRRRSIRPVSIGLLLSVSLFAASIGVVAIPVAAQKRGGPPPSTPVTVGTYQVQVPKAWPVVDLGRDPAACYRVDKSAAFMGHPSSSQCPPHIVGRADTVLVEPLDNMVTSEAPVDATAPAGQVPAVSTLANMTHQLRVEVSDARVVVTITWGKDWSTVASVLASGHLVPPGSTTSSAPSTSASTTTAPTTSAPNAVTPTTASWSPPAAPDPPAQASPIVVPSRADPAALSGQLVTGQGFDSCTLPPASLMGTLRNETGWTFAGFYLGGVNAACPNTSLGLPWVNSVTGGGWGLAPLWVGPQAPTSSCSSCALLSSSAQGSAEADAAVSVARSIGMTGSSPIFYDMESYATGLASGAVIGFLSAWTAELHRLGYVSGVYSSAATGISDLVATYNTTLHPDLVWIADWNGAATSADPFVPGSDWPNHQRLHQFASSTMHGPVNLPGFSLQYDSDVADAPLVRAGNPLLAFAAAKYVNFIYRAVLGRPADPVGIAAFVPAIVNGVPRAAILETVLVGNEALRRDVALDYGFLLGRPPDGGGSSYWTYILAVTHRNDLVQASLIGSGEFFRKAGNTAASWVVTTYRDILGRNPDPSGLSFWTAQLRRGASRFAIALGLVDSVESSRRIVGDVYLVFLHRAPDPGGLSYHTSVYRRNFDLFTVADALGSSDEAWLLAQRLS